LTKLLNPGVGTFPVAGVGAGIDDLQGAAAVAGRMTSAFTGIAVLEDVGILEKAVGVNEGLPGAVIGRIGGAPDGGSIRGFIPGGSGSGSSLKGKPSLPSSSERSIGRTKLPTAIPQQIYSMIRCCCSVGK
jgi:hypothetical protein